MTDQSPAYHYQVIARALDVIDREGPALTLEDLAAKMRMSPAHFQRIFSQWVGVSPKRYQQYLAIGQARRLLAERHTVLAAAHETGLSGGGRLHDLFLTWEAMSPGDYARGGEGLTIRWGWFESPFGPALVMATERGICGMGFADEVGAEAALEDLVSRWPKATYVEDPVALRPLVDAAFGGKATELHLIGAPFQIKVWEALLAIPTGHVTTYADIAGRSATRRRTARWALRSGGTRSRSSSPATGRCGATAGLAAITGVCRESARCWRGKRPGRRPDPSDRMGGSLPSNSGTLLPSTALR